MQKGLAPIVIVLILAGVTLLVGGGYYLGTRQSETSNPVVFPSPQLSPSPTHDASREPTGSAETANWKTYTNNQYSFYFKYPPILGSVIIDSTSKLNVSLKKDLKQPYVLFDLYVKPKDGESLNSTPRKTIMINNIKWDVFSPGGSCTGLTACQGIPYYQSIRNNFVYIFIYPDPLTEKDLVSILNTFKFL